MKPSTKTVLITGGTSGIGWELAKLFAADRYDLIIVARNNEQLMAAENELKSVFGVSVLALSKDLSLPDAAFEVYKEITDRGIDIDVLVNDAGQGLYGEFSETNIYRELAIIQLNICSVVVLTKYFLKDMLSRGSGKILNLSSIASKAPGPLQSVYHASKAFVQSFTEAVRNEVKDAGVTLTALLPGATDTDFFNKAEMTEAKNVKEGKLGSAADVAQDGYNALMKGDDMVVSGVKNKVMVAMSNILPDHVVAENVHQQQKPVDKN